MKRTNAENSKQIFPEKELRDHSPNFHIHVSVSDLYILTIDRSQTHWMWKLRMRPRACPEKENINGIWEFKAHILKVMQTQYVNVTTTQLCTAYSFSAFNML